MKKILIFDLWSSWNFISIEDIRKKCGAVVDFSKFISIKKILSVVSIYNQVCCQLCQKCNYDKPKEFSMVKIFFVGNMHVMCAMEN